MNETPDLLTLRVYTMDERSNPRFFPYTGSRIYHELEGEKSWLKHPEIRPLR